jgi:hypothetical protein
MKLKVDFIPKMSFCHVLGNGTGLLYLLLLPGCPKTQIKNIYTY